MDRFVFGLPESVDELCLVKLGLVVRKLRGWPESIRLARKIRRSAEDAIRGGAGLLASEKFSSGLGHFGVWQYWSSFVALEAWSHRPPHSDWWRDAVERMRRVGDIGVYHETYLVPRGGVESIYLDCPPVGLATFGVKGEAVGLSTTSRDRLGRRGERG